MIILAGNNSSSSTNNARLAVILVLALRSIFCVGGSFFTVSATEEVEGFIKTKKKNASSSIVENTAAMMPLSCTPSSFEPSILEKPCELDEKGGTAPAVFSLVFPTQYGKFTADCVRERAPVWADRVYKLAQHGYYNRNNFFRVIPGKYIQFGTNGDPAVSNLYNYTSTTEPECSILRPQPPGMPYCLASSPLFSSSHNCTGVPALSNTFGTLAMSTSYKEGIAGYPNGVTWNATAELFINIGNNHFLDSNLFVPICSIDQKEMEDVVLQFPSFGEVAELGGNGPSLGLLYQDGNSYIESNPEWNASMAITSTVSVCTAVRGSSNSNSNSNSKSSSNNNHDRDIISNGNGNDNASAGTIATNDKHSRYQRLPIISSLLWKGVAVWLISLIVLH